MKRLALLLAFALPACQQDQYVEISLHYQPEAPAVTAPAECPAPLKPPMLYNCGEYPDPDICAGRGPGWNDHAPDCGQKGTWISGCYWDGWYCAPLDTFTIVVRCEEVAGE